MNRMIYAALVAGSIAFASCKSSTEPATPPPPPPPAPPPAPPPDPPPSAPTLSIRDTTLLLHESLSVTATDGSGQLIPNASITVTSSAEAVVSVSGSAIMALALGTSIITATMDSITAQATVTVAKQFTHLATGGYHACGITGRGDVYCWGASIYGALGTSPDLLDCGDRFGGNAPCSPVPIRLSGLRPVALAAGEAHTCALDASGAAYCWGANFYGQAGGASQTALSTPTLVSGGHSFVQLVAGRWHTCGITTSRTAYCWGADWTGSLGGGDVPAERCDHYLSAVPCSRLPRLVVGQHQWADLSANDRATCGLTLDGELYCWGLDVGGDDGMYCQEPDNLAGCTRTPLLIASERKYKAVNIGNVHHCQQAMNGTLDCWGANYWGMFGNGNTDYSATPISAAGGAAFESFVAVRTGTCALTVDGHALCWGRGEEGAVGNGTFADALSPAAVTGGHLFVDLAASGNSEFVCGMTSTGRAHCWGHGGFGQLGNNSFLSSSVPVLVRLVPTQAAP